MSGFGQSFDKAFVPGANAGAAASLEVMKEKIKKNDEKRQSDAIFDLIHTKVVEDAIKNGADDKTLKEIEKKIKMILETISNKLKLNFSFLIFIANSFSFMSNDSQTDFLSRSFINFCVDKKRRWYFLKLSHSLSAK
jgi:hypothetical protein